MILIVTTDQWVVELNYNCQNHITNVHDCGSFRSCWIPMNEDQAKEQRKDLKKALRRILRTDSVPQNAELLRDNLLRVWECFNSYYATGRFHWELLTAEDKRQALVGFANDRRGVERCLDRVPDIASLLSVSTELGDLIVWKSGKILVGNETAHPGPIPSRSKSSDEYEDSSSVENKPTIVTMNAIDVIKTVNNTLRPYSGLMSGFLYS